MAARTILLLLLAFPAMAAQAAGTGIRPGDGALVRAIRDAAPGDILLPGPGHHRGPVHIDRTLTLRGGPGVWIEGNGSGSVITIDAPGVTVSDLAIRGSGNSHETMDSGIRLTANAAGARIINNRLYGNLHGVDIHGARDTIVSGNTIMGQDGPHMNARGNGVYIWNAPGAIVENNVIRLGRDGIFVNTSRNNILRNNRLAELRFAIHYMYAHDGRITGNHSAGNHLGFALMFSDRLRILSNLSDGDREHGIMLNATGHSVIAGNLVRGNRQRCLFMYNANRNIVRDNRLEGCPVGIHYTAGSEGNVITGNSFLANRRQVKYVGSRRQEWSSEGRGNFWSDHAAFDIDGDGIADRPYRSGGGMDRLLWEQPMAWLLLGSPAVQLVRWAQDAFPAFLPGGVTDSAPLMRPPAGILHQEPASAPATGKDSP